MSTKMTPQLRFPEFNDEWQVKKLGDVFERVTRKNKENNQNILTISAQDGLVSQEKFFSKIVAAKDVSGYYLLHKNDYAYNKSYSKGYPMGAIKRLSREEKGVVSTLYICFSSKQGLELFFDQYFEAGRLNTEIEKIAQEGARNHGLLNMAVRDFFTTKLVIPVSKPEQEKIADFLTAVDERIAVGEKKLELLETYKRGVMQKIFSQQIRFKDENGNDYPEWEEKKLGDIAKKENSPISANEIVGRSGKYKVYGASGLLQTLDSYNQGESYTAIVKDGAGVGRLMWCEAESSVLGTLNIIKPKLDGSSKFLHYLLHTINFQRYSIGSTIPHVYFSDYSKHKLVVPENIEEQQKIANLLTTLDDKIKLEEAKLASSKEFKKALLQRMFV